MTKLKSADELIKLYYVNQEDFIEVIKQAQLDAIQATVEMCAEEATLLEDGVDIGKEYFMEKYNTFYSDTVFSINNQSILNVADKMIKELNNQ